MIEFEELWVRMKELANSGKEFATIGGRTSFRSRLIAGEIEINSTKAKGRQMISKDSARENYKIFIKLKPEDRYNTSYYTQTWDKVYVLRFFKEILKE